MGDFLTKPITEKNATDGKNSILKYGACSMQGWRKSNEDAHIHVHEDWEYEESAEDLNTNDSMSELQKALSEASKMHRHGDGELHSH